MDRRVYRDINDFAVMYSIVECLYMTVVFYFLVLRIVVYGMDKLMPSVRES